MRRALCFGTAALLLLSAVALKATVGDVLPERLSDTGLETLGRPFSPQYPLWSDGATKRRWLYLPPGATIDTSNVDDWEFPVGTKFWKEFSVGGRKVETRVLFKASADRWIARSYAWNESGTEATLAPVEGLVTSVEVAPGRRHVIPSAADCLACHGTRRTGPLGFNALQLSTDRDPLAIHGEPLAPGMVTLETLISEERLTPSRTELLASPPRIGASDPNTRAVLGYLSANCGTCHNGRGEIATLGPSLGHSDVRDGDAVVRALLDQPTIWQVPGLPEGRSMLVSSYTPDASAILVRMRSRRPSSQMPPLGTLVRDEQALGVIADWIMQTACRPQTDRTVPAPARPAAADTRSSARGDAPDDSSCRAVPRDAALP